MAKVTVRVAMHRNHPDKFVKLMNDIVEQHEELGASSPLNNATIINMAEFKAKLLQAETLRNESIAARALAESKMGQAKALLGTANGQTINTTGTLFNILGSIKKYLLFHHDGEEEALSEYGFDVVVGTAKFIGRPRKNR